MITGSHGGTSSNPYRLAGLLVLCGCSELCDPMGSQEA
jgi:hypothetical protein